MKKIPTCLQLTDEKLRIGDSPLIIYRELSNPEELVCVIGRVGVPESIILNEQELIALREYLVALLAPAVGV